MPFDFSTWNSTSAPYSIEALTLGRKRSITASGSDAIAIIPDVVISEEHDDEVTVTRHPVDHGAPISDHAFKNPAVLSVRFGWSDSSRLLNSVLDQSILRGFLSTEDVYKQLLKLMDDRELLTVSTGKRIYQNMIITKLSTSSTAETESALICDITFEEVIIVSAQSTVLVPDVQKNPAQTASPVNGGQRQTTSVDEIPILPS
nr:MAG TPA: hypothetical protein [Caudoviricetes sp.]